MKRKARKLSLYERYIEEEFIRLQAGQFICDQRMHRDMCVKLGLDPDEFWPIHVNRSRPAKKRHFYKIIKYYDRAHGLEGVLA